ncbi:MAG: proteasome accessory factor PafA2 family protein [Deltaproteobacteria bacterium]|nr:proteasome accessory factor PafA2 family protein [Deltaproteobacteria bacterium]
MEKSEENIEEKSNRKSKKKGKRTYHGRVIGRDRSRYARPEQPREAPRRVAKICGSDYELANFVLNDEDRDGTGHQASRALLEKIEGKSPAARWSGTGSGSWGSGSGSYSVQEGSSGVVYTDYTNYTSYASAYSGTDAQDWGRKYHENGGCTYIDLCHLEICIPEVRSAWDHVAANRAMLEIAARAQASLNAELPEDRRIEVLANNSDGRGHSYGTHLNICLTREAWNDIFHNKIQKMLVLASFQVSSIVFAGQGKVGAENGRPWVPFQISQRADFMETLTGLQTTYERPIVNSRDESLCGRIGEKGEGLARLHVIFYDNNLCQTAALLKIGTLQILVAMLEGGWCDLGLVLDDPVEAVLHYSHGADLLKRCELASGEAVTAVELQLRFVKEARKALEAGLLDTVPRAAELIELWEDTLLKLQAGDLEALAGRLDWVLKLSMIERTLEQRDDLCWESPELVYLDQIYSSLDRERGLFWAYEEAGAVERVVSEDDVTRFIEEPPDDTRAWTRGQLLRLLEPEQISSIDWHEVGVRITEPGGWRSTTRVLLGDPGGSTRSQNLGVFTAAEDVEEVVRVLAARGLGEDIEAEDTEAEEMDVEDIDVESIDAEEQPKADAPLQLVTDGVHQ